MLINKIFDYISKKSPYNIQTPWVEELEIVQKKFIMAFLKLSVKVKGLFSSSPIICSGNLDSLPPL